MRTCSKTEYRNDGIIEYIQVIDINYYYLLVLSFLHSPWPPAFLGPTLAHRHISNFSSTENCWNGRGQQIPWILKSKPKLFSHIACCVKAVICEVLTAQKRLSRRSRPPVSRSLHLTGPLFFQRFFSRKTIESYPVRRNIWTISSYTTLGHS